MDDTEELEIIKAQMDERGESMTDTGPLVKLKDAMKKIKKEIKVFVIFCSKYYDLSVIS